MPEIIVINPQKPETNQTINLTLETKLNQECLLGRDERCCVVLNDSMVSRMHGKIALRDGNYYYCDLGSRNGSKVNNETAKANQEYLLKPADMISIGSHLLWVKGIDPIEEVETPSQELTPRQYMPLATIEPDSLQRWSSGELTVRCVQIIPETRDVKTFSFLPIDFPVLFTYQPGQFITLVLDIDGKTVRRSYSISSTPSRPHNLEITVKRVPAPDDDPTAPPGLVSNWLHDNLKVGSQIKIGAPMGKFTNFANPSRKILLISAGSGITPMMSMSRWICDTVSEVDMIFVHSAKTPKDIIFRSELEMMAARYPKFKLAITITRPEPGIPWFGYTGRLTESILPAIAPDFMERTVYVCGPNPFMEAAKAMMEKLNFPMQNYYEESFGAAPKKKKPATPTIPVIPVSPDTRILPPKPPITPPPITPPPITPPQPAPITPSPQKTVSPIIVFNKSQREIPYDGEGFILDLAEAEGIDIPAGCRMGMCGACKTKKISGEVIYDNDVNCEEGYIHACVAKPVGKVVVEA
jgi:ferredoxin-NADP reductase/ferredoxin